MSRNSITIKLYGRHDEIEATFPCKWIICQGCDGHGTTTRHIECDGGGFTASEWAEACSDDPDFAENYFSGAYDRPCPVCKGLGRVQTIDTEHPMNWRQKIFLSAFTKQEADRYHDDRVSYYERRAGC